MALPPAHPQRQLRHRRRIDVEVFTCGDGVWQVDAHLSDIKTFDVDLHTGTRPAGVPIHDMTLRLVVDESFGILDAGAESRHVPYPGFCEHHGNPDESGDAYRRLIGLNLMFGFAAAVKERLGGAKGCTHLTEICKVLPTAVLQGFAGTVKFAERFGEQRPFQLDRCHALRSDAEAVRIHYPRWHAPRVAHPAAEGPTPAPSDSPKAPGSHQARA